MAPTRVIAHSSPHAGVVAHSSPSELGLDIYSCSPSHVFVSNLIDTGCTWTQRVLSMPCNGKAPSLKWFSVHEVLWSFQSRSRALFAESEQPVIFFAPNVLRVDRGVCSSS